MRGPQAWPSLGQLACLLYHLVKDKFSDYYLGITCQNKVATVPEPPAEAVAMPEGTTLWDRLFQFLCRSRSWLQALLTNDGTNI